jgi:hypothetical protein
MVHSKAAFDVTWPAMGLRSDFHAHHATGHTIERYESADIALRFIKQRRDAISTLPGAAHNLLCQDTAWFVNGGFRFRHPALTYVFQVTLRETGQLMGANAASRVEHLIKRLSLRG